MRVAEPQEITKLTMQSDAECCSKTIGEIMSVFEKQYYEQWHIQKR